MAIEVRPTFTLDVPARCAAVTERLRVGLERQPVWTRWARLPGARAEQAHDGTYVLIAPPEDRQQFFSPWLQVSIQPQPDGSTQLFGRFGPRPAVWTAFAFSYLFFGCVMFFAAMGGLAQLTIGVTPWALWITLAAAAVCGGLFWASQVGQRLARGQMAGLREAVDAALAGVPVPAESVAD